MVSYWQTQQILALVNLAMCLAVIWSCICRLNTDVCRTYLKARFRYAALLVGAMAHGLQPVLFNSMPGYAGTLFSFGVITHLLLGVENWRDVLPHKPSKESI